MKFLYTFLIVLGSTMANSQDISRPYFSSGTFKGFVHPQKPTLLYFSASWCAPCVQKLVLLSQNWAALQDSLSVRIITDWEESDKRSSISYASGKIDSAYFTPIDEQYYKKKSSFINISINSAHKAIDRLHADLEKTRGLQNAKDLWFGKAILVAKGKASVIDVDTLLPK